MGCAGALCNGPSQPRFPQQNQLKAEGVLDFMRLSLATSKTVM